MQTLYIYILYILYIQHQDLSLYVSLYVCMFETYLLRNGWTDLKNSFFVSSVLVMGRFQAKKISIFEKKISRIFCSQFRIILYNVNTTIQGEALKHPIAAKPLEASGEVASMLYSHKCLKNLPFNQGFHLIFAVYVCT